MSEFKNTVEYAQILDKQDPLAKFREEFRFPKRDNKQLIYFCGNSLGLQPKRVKNQLGEELEKWADYGVEGHFKAQDPWINYHELLKETTAEIVGAKTSEVVIMNTLTVNIHLLMVSFYNPTAKRFKIICEQGAFPSDMYAMISQVKFRGFNPDEAIIELKPREGEQTLRREDIVQTILETGDELALIWMGGVNYYTGQAFIIKEITEAGHKAGAIVGFDLAHAAGNLELNLHEHNVDFATWCTYKYMNSGPGGIAAAFIHERHGNRSDLPRFTGWWGNDLSSRFMMSKEFSPAPGAEGWSLSTSPIMLMAPLRSSLEVFKEAGFKNLIAKRKLLTAYLEEVINDIAKRYGDVLSIRIITPENDAERGAQLSMVVEKNGKVIFNQLNENGVISDWREPEVIRLAPAPLYNSFEDVYRFGKIFEEILEQESLKNNAVLSVA